MRESAVTGPGVRVMSGSRPSAPAGIGEPGAALWRSILGDLDAGWELGSRELHLLARAARCADELANLEAVVDRDGVTVTGARSQVIVHPAVTEARQWRQRPGLLPPRHHTGPLPHSARPCRGTGRVRGRNTRPSRRTARLSIPEARRTAARVMPTRAAPRLRGPRRGPDTHASAERGPLRTRTRRQPASRSTPLASPRVCMRPKHRDRPWRTSRRPVRSTTTARSARSPRGAHERFVSGGVSGLSGGARAAARG